MNAQPRCLNAGNAGPFTLDGTRTYLVGRRSVAVIDAGPALDAHLAAVKAAVSDADRVTVIVTHGHPDHAPGSRSLAKDLGVDLWGPAGVDGVTRSLADGDVVATDEGDLIAVDTPGHARRHLGFHWPAGRAFFAADLLLGKGDTVWVGEYPGSVADYLASLERVGALDIDVVYPAHGSALEDPADAIARFTAHRHARIRQMEDLLAAKPGATTDELLQTIHGSDLPESARRAAARSIEALRAHVEGAR